VDFCADGWGKLHNLAKVTEFFRSLGIPAPQIQAPFASGMEFLCGGLVLIGLFTPRRRRALIVIMAVAIKTAKMGDVKDISDFLSLSDISCCAGALAGGQRPRRSVTGLVYLQTLCRSPED